MNVQLSEESRRFVADQVRSGRYPSEGAVLEEAVRRMRGQEPSTPGGSPPDPGPLWGLFRDEPGLMDEVVAEAMQARERRWRRPPGE